MDVLPAHLNRDSFRDSFKGLVALEIIFDLPFGFPINNIISPTRIQVVGIIPESGEVLTHYHHMFNKTDKSCCQMKMGMVEYLGADHHMFNQKDTTCDMSMWVWCRTWVLYRPCKWVPDVVVIFLCIASITSNIYRNNATCSRINSIGLVKKESKTGAYRYRHDGYGDTPG